ncbi:MAG: hypothetical protein COV55_04200 [Candidatus Komeilibacteria bacterium CG11_big_fil_rev_8_21_14_0_20_36_20]|uniref:Uncharacterized protein n=1 Tax=Candidatus Komeilibacteria bacterium CG11_big_fil_rev_8_21_14_0_20_36_20 TaxID=1974477 RepID=A0A2H0NBN6_9BACT|nr:MAG: hypothetical protein COV55_04200 [Candidatus Komeilibacteria bacterium CG11_big_fil_rev_8_21_14_0_20_36_20]PIR81445.1 MAG: hypothetical protein COU21_03430 [Candidatus Komeilibacteria bacterium CG10_big_fil_rev_8_21_14_0_10_36_65]PJC55646.1 MAG: hypothetical protein CO027_00785 [Candidatus Komeilibacteria bacterium CG_4_9_14_0_2_um_filter_36_13]
MKISEEIVLLYKKLDRIYHRRELISQEENKIEVEDITSHLASLYEKLRNSIDFKDAHLLRRFAIERNLKRRFILEMLKPQIAKSLLEELIRAHYLPNNSVPESYIKQVEKIIEKYNDFFLLMNDMYHGDDIKDYFEWLIGIEACEIDMLLQPEDIEDAVIEAMYQVTKTRIKLKGDEINIEEKNIQLYIAIHKSLVKSDDTIISYHLLNLYFNNWLKADDRLIKLMASKLPAIYNTIQYHLRHPYQRKILQSIKEPVVTFQILYELILSKGQDIESLLVDPESLESEAKLLINQKYKKIRGRIRRSSLRAIIYIFVTKVLLALILEFPYEVYIIKHINYFNLGINVVFPPLLMFLITLTIVPPNKENTKLILENLHNLVYNRPSQSILCKLSTKFRKSLRAHMFYYFMYTLLYVAVFGLIIYMLRRLEFNILSGGLFLFFLSAVSFFAIKIRSTAKELMVLKRKESIISFFMNFFSLPILAVGRWMSVRFKKINIFAFVMDFIIEAPFKMFISAFEDWLGFMKEKKEEIYHEK